MNLNHYLKASWAILSKPTPGNFRELSWGARDTVGGSLAWAAGLISLVAFALGLSSSGVQPWWVGLILGVVLIPLWLLLFVYLQHQLSFKLFRIERSHYPGLLLANALILGPILGISVLAILVGFPLRLAAMILSVYYLVLIVISLVGITGVKVWQAVLITLFSGILAAGGLILGTIFAFSLLWTVPELL